MALWPFKRKSLKEPSFSGPDFSSPEKLVLSFAADFKTWNDFCDTASAGRDDCDMDQFSRLYAQFLKPFVMQGVELQLISFGSVSEFDPERIKIDEVEQTGNGSKVHFSVRKPGFDMSDDFVAELKPDETSRLRIQQVFYVDPHAEDGETHLPCL